MGKLSGGWWCLKVNAWWYLKADVLPWWTYRSWFKFHFTINSHKLCHKSCCEDFSPAVTLISRLCVWQRHKPTKKKIRVILHRSGRSSVLRHDWSNVSAGQWGRGEEGQSCFGTVRGNWDKCGCTLSVDLFLVGDCFVCYVGLGSPWCHF